MEHHNSQNKDRNTRIVEAIHKVADIVAQRDTSLKDVLQKIVESFKDVSNATACAIFLMDDTKSKLIMKAGVGYSEEAYERITYDLSVRPDEPEIGMTAWIALNRRKFSARNRAELEAHPAWAGKHDLWQHADGRISKSFIGVPLLVADEVIGVIRSENKLDNEQETYFTWEEEEVFEALSRIAAIAISNAKAPIERERELQRTVDLYFTGTVLREQKDIKNLIYIFLAGLTNGYTIGFNRAIYFDYYPTTRRLIGQLAIGPYNQKEAKDIKKQVEGKDLTIKYSIKPEAKKINFESKLNRSVQKRMIDLDKKDLCVNWIEMGATYFAVRHKSNFSRPVCEFMEEIEMENCLLIGISTRAGYRFVMCDNIYSGVALEERNKLLAVFIPQMSQALDRIYSQEEIRIAKESAWQESSAMAAHRLGNILPLAQNRIKDVLKKYATDESEDLLKKSLEDMKIAMRVLNDFKQFAQSARIKLDDTIKARELIEFIRSLINDYNDALNIGVGISENMHNLEMHINKESLQMVFLTLLANTAEANPDFSKLKLYLEEASIPETRPFHLPKHCVKIIYQDDGPGIPKEKKQAVFEPFETTKPGNSGLGLAIVKNIIEQHGGDVFENGEPEKGARFNIILPII